MTSGACGCRGVLRVGLPSPPSTPPRTFDPQCAVFALHCSRARDDGRCSRVAHRRIGHWVTRRIRPARRVASGRRSSPSIAVSPRSAEEHFYAADTRSPLPALPIAGTTAWSEHNWHSPRAVNSLSGRRFTDGRLADACYSVRTLSNGSATGNPPGNEAKVAVGTKVCWLLRRYHVGHYRSKGRQH